jgi:hypothetical protein
VMPCTVIEVCRHFRETCCIHHESIQWRQQVSVRRCYTSIRLCGITCHTTCSLIYIHSWFKTKAFCG